MQPLDQVLVSESVVGVEPFIEILGAVEDIGKQEIQKSPEFMKIVLERSSCDQKSVGCLDLSDDLGQFALLVLNPAK